MAAQRPLDHYRQRALALVVDTNIFIHSLPMLQQIVASLPIQFVVLVPYAVISELDKLKLSSTVSTHAQTANAWLYSQLSQNTTVVVGQRMNDVVSTDCQSPDDSILDCCRFAMMSFARHVVLVSNDKNLCVKALVHAIKTLSDLKNRQDGMLVVAELARMATEFDHANALPFQDYTKLSHQRRADSYTNGYADHRNGDHENDVMMGCTDDEADHLPPSHYHSHPTPVSTPQYLTKLNPPMEQEKGPSTFRPADYRTKVDTQTTGMRTEFELGDVLTYLCHIIVTTLTACTATLPPTQCIPLPPSNPQRSSVNDVPRPIGSLLDAISLTSNPTTKRTIASLKTQTADLERSMRTGELKLTFGDLREYISKMDEVITSVCGDCGLDSMSAIEALKDVLVRLETVR